MQDFRDTTVVITGASSGIGRATAESFARAGATVVLASRRADVLERVADICRQLGGKALAVPTDVTDAAAVAGLARRAAEFGDGIDVWINNAGVGAVGRFEETPIGAHDQVLRVNLMGSLHGAHAVLPYFKQQGAGVLVNLLSLGAWAPTPYAVSYTASKYGLRGYSEALRAELHGWPGIRICDVFPSVVDTPGFAHGANYTGKTLKPPPLVYDARRVARAANALAPALVRLGTALLFEAYFRRADAAPRTDGTLFQPDDSASSIDGGWRQAQRESGTSQLGLLAGVGLLGLIVLSKLRR